MIRGGFRFRQIQPAMEFAASHLDADLSLDALAAQAGLSAFHLHLSLPRGCRRDTQTLRLEAAAGEGGSDVARQPGIGFGCSAGVRIPES